MRRADRFRVVGYCSGVQVAGDPVAGPDFLEGWRDRPAVVHDPRAAGVEMAPGGRRDGAGDVPHKHDPVGPLNLRIGDLSTAEQN